jgi:hypothetical protein
MRYELAAKRLALSGTLAEREGSIFVCDVEWRGGRVEEFDERVRVDLRLLPLRRETFSFMWPVGALIARHELSQQRPKQKFG